MILLQIHNGQRCIGRCDARCYLAVHGVCSCICQGKNHGVGLRKALDQTRDEHAAWIKKARRQHGKKCEAKINEEIWQPSLDFGLDEMLLLNNSIEEDDMGDIFRGMRTREGIVVAYNGHELPPRNDWRNHSPDGFEWGYGGSGPAQLALAILGALFSKRLALAHYQAFKFKIVAGLPKAGFTLTGEVVREWMRQHLKELDDAHEQAEQDRE
jgi:hypothetical protein